MHLLLATGPAFADAVATIIHFVQPENPCRHTSIFSIGEADEQLYAVDPQKMLNLLTAVVGDVPSQSVYGLNKALQKLSAKAPHLCTHPAKAPG